MFNTATALINAMAYKHNIKPDDIERVTLDINGNNSSYMYVNKHTKETIGYGSFTYQGMQPGRGKVWLFNGQFA